MMDQPHPNALPVLMLLAPQQPLGRQKRHAATTTFQHEECASLAVALRTRPTHH